MSITVADLRRFAVTRTLFPPTTLKRAIEKMGFVQADPIRAPARAQDLTLRHRVKGYRAGDLERRYAELDVEEDFFVNYGFLPRAVQKLMHPRMGASVTVRGRKAEELLAFVRAREAVHPREVDDQFSHGSVTNYWGGSSTATTHLLNRMHYHGVLRVARRSGGIRLYAAHVHTPGPADAAGRRIHVDALVDLAVQVYAPVPSATLSWLVNRLRYAAPQWTGELPRALKRAKERLSHAHAEGHRLVLAGARGPPRARPRGPRSLSGAVRPDRLGPPPFRAALGLGLPVRGLHTGASPQAWLLRAANLVARPHHRLGKPLRREWRVASRSGVCRPAAAAGTRVRARAGGRARPSARISRPLT